MSTDDAGATPLPPGFSDVELLATTGSGPLYRARVATADGRIENVAVALVKSPIRDRGARRRLRSDCLAAVAINAEPDVLAVRDLGFTNDHRPFLVTDLPALGTLAGRLERTGPVPPGEVVALGLGLARALAAAHRQGVLHLGIGPDVVFYTQDERPVLGHFGLAWAVRPPTQPDVPALTIVHAPRELFGWEEPTVGSDVYGLASVLRTALSGQAPFEVEARIGRAALYHRLVQGGPPPLVQGSVPEALATLLNRMMDPDPTRRPSVDEVGRTLDEVSRMPGMAVVATRVAAVAPTAVVSQVGPPSSGLVAQAMPPRAATMPIQQAPPQPPALAPPIVQPQPPHHPPQSPMPAPSPTQPQSPQIPQFSPNQPQPQHVQTSPPTTPQPPEPEPGRRNTGLILLATAGIAALAAGIAWGVATAPKKAAAASPGPLVGVSNFTGDLLAAYEVTNPSATLSGSVASVSWGPSQKAVGVQDYVVLARLYDQTVQYNTVAGGATTTQFTGLKPGSPYCFVIITIAQAPGDSASRTATYPDCVLPTSPSAAAPTPTRSP